jgi:hypothetical protein
LYSKENTRAGKGFLIIAILGVICAFAVAAAGRYGASGQFEIS